MNSYKVLSKQVYSKDEFKIIPIRFEDRYDIMKWRNEQIDILRQDSLLTEEMQDEYFNNVVLNLFDKAQPEQLLFSFLKDGELIGYGGLVHIDWKNKNAEISFLLNTDLNYIDFYLLTFDVFLNLIKEVAISIDMHKIFTYGYCTEEYRFKPLIHNNYILEAKLKDHVLINEKLTDVKIYSKIL